MTIYRYEVPVDDQWHEIAMGGDVGTGQPILNKVLAVGCRCPDVVEFWAWAPIKLTVIRYFKVVGTGQPILNKGGQPHHWGTAYAPGTDGRLVWHLIEAVSSW